jgi:hypothetical protein
MITAARAKDAVIVDVDGTLCDVTQLHPLLVGKGRDLNAFHKASADMPANNQALRFCERHHAADRVVVVVTARMYRWEQLTLDWLGKYVTFPFVGPFMRDDHDIRPDVEVKRDIYGILTSDHRYNIVAACDDNPSIVELWESLNIPVEVIPGWI